MTSNKVVLKVLQKVFVSCVQSNKCAASFQDLLTVHRLQYAKMEEEGLVRFTT